jgi:hypothetical protein
MSEPVDPNLAPPPGNYAPPPSPPPPPGYAPPSQPQPAGYTPQPGWSDPLFVPPGSSFGAWYNKVIEIVKRSWRSVLMITGVGIALPAGIVSLVSWLSYGYYATSATLLFHMGTLFDTGQLLFGAFITFVFAVAAFFVTAAAWAAAVYTITLEANGERTNINAAFSYGLKRAGSLWLWTIVAAVIVAIGTCLLILPGIYAGFALSLFGFVVVFERGQNPIARSFKLTHADLGPTLGKVAVLAAAAFVYEIIVNAIIGSIESGIISNGFVGFDFSFGARFGVGIVSLIGDLLVLTPVTGLLLMGLLPVYAEQRAREIQLSTGLLRQQLG